MNDEPSRNSAIVEHGENISQQSHIDIISDWGFELAVTTVLAVSGVLCVRLIKKLDDTHKSTVANTNELYKYRCTVDTKLAQHDEKFNALEQCMTEIKQAQQKTVDRLDRIIEMGNQALKRNES